MSSGQVVNEAEAKLREWLETSGPSPGTRLPSERTLARQLGVGHYALNRAMGRLVSDGIVVRDGYRLFFADSAHTSLAFTCHLIAARRSVHLRSYLQVARRMGIRLILHPWLSIEESLLLLHQLDIQDTEAVVFDPTHVLSDPGWEAVTTRFAKRGIPLICVGQPVPNLFSVVPDHPNSLLIAIEHLTKLGHREIGLVTAPPANPAAGEVLRAWGDQCRHHDLVMSIPRVHLQSSIRYKEEADDLAGMVVRDWNSVTALVISSTVDCNIPLLQKRLDRLGRNVPEDLSLLSIGNASTEAVAKAIDAVSFDMTVLQEAAFHFAQRAIREKKPMGILPRPSTLRIQCQLSEQGSIKPVLSPIPPMAGGPLPSPASALSPSYEPPLQKDYSLAVRASLSDRPRFAQLDLSAHVNRPLHFRRGWLGDLPLKQLPPGPREVHGVPFQILGGPGRNDCGAIVFHSAINTTGNRQKLPDRLRIPIGTKARAIYVLHGCGYTKFRQAFADYDFCGPQSRIERIPIVSLGLPPPGYDPRAPVTDGPAPNIQDWWSDYPHVDFPHAHSMPLQKLETAHDVPRQVYLYTLEWINPSPDTIVSHLDISVNSDLTTTLGVLAITVLSP